MDEFNIIWFILQTHYIRYKLYEQIQSYHDDPHVIYVTWIELSDWRIFALQRLI